MSGPCCRYESHNAIFFLFIPQMLEEWFFITDTVTVWEHREAEDEGKRFECDDLDKCPAQTSAELRIDLFLPIV